MAAVGRDWSGCFLLDDGISDADLDTQLPVIMINKTLRSMNIMTMIMMVMMAIIPSIMAMDGHDSHGDYDDHDDHDDVDDYDAEHSERPFSTLETRSRTSSFQSHASRRDQEFLPFSLMLRDEIENFCLSVSCFETRMRI